MSVSRLLLPALLVVSGIASASEPTLLDAVRAVDTAVRLGAMPADLPRIDTGALDETTARKYDAVRALAAAATAAPDMRRQAREQAVVYVLDGDAPLGGRCTQPLALTGEAPVTVALGRAGSANDRVWLRWQAPAAGLWLLSTRGSDIDTTLAARAHCNGDELSADDDSYGLAAELVLQAHEAGQVWLIEAGNLGKAGTLEILSTTARVISGRVTDEASGEPIQGVRLRAFSLGGGVDGMATSGPDGQYQISLWGSADEAVFVRTGEWSPRRWVHELWDDVPCIDHHEGSIASCGAGTPIEVAPGQTRTGIDFALSRGVALGGRVRDALSGEPIADATVMIRDSDGTWLMTQAVDAAGRFRIDGFIVGATVQAWAAAPSHASQAWASADCEHVDCSGATFTPITLTAAGAAIDFPLQPKAYIDVDLSVDGTAWSGWRWPLFTVENAAGIRTPFQPTPYSGRYRIGPLEPGSYAVMALIESVAALQLHEGVICSSNCVAEIGQATRIEVDAGARPLIAMDLQSLPVIHGRVTDADGEPLRGARVRAYRVGSPHVFADGDADEEGRYRIEGLSVGSYFVHASAVRHIDQLHAGITCESSAPMQTCAAGQAVVIDPLAGDIEVDFALAVAPILSGRLLSGGMVLPASALSSYDAAVRLLRNDLQAVAGTSLTIDAASGRYVLSDYVPASYFVGARISGFFPQLHSGVHCPYNSWSWSWFVQCPIELATPLALGSDDVELDFDLEPRDLRRVRVFDAASGQPLAGIVIDLWSSSGGSLGVAVTDAGGRALVGLDAWDPIQVRVSTDNYAGYLDMVHSNIRCPEGTSVYRGGCSLTGATAITLPATAPGQPPIEFPLLRGVDIFENGFE